MAAVLRVIPRKLPGVVTIALAIGVAIVLFVPVRGFAQDPAVSPDWTLEDVAGNRLNLDELVAEQPTILFFWATWCPYCKALMPHLQSLRLEYGDDLNIIALTIRDDDGDPVGYVRENGFDFTMIVDADEIAAQNDVYGTPGVLILDKDREVVFNLYALGTPEYPARLQDAGHGPKAAYRAPWWAAEIRQSLDGLIADAYAD